MKISETGNSTNELISMYKINEGKVGSESEEQAVNSVAPEDKVSLSSTARDIQLAEKAIEKLPDIREEKVQALKDQIATGRYNVSGEKIAEKMINELFVDIMA